MSTMWFVIDGKRASVSGQHADIIEKIRELRADGHSIKAARPPKPIGPRGYAIASSHVRR
jgi:hypothetical protein